jgi:hypothetical protein
MRKPNRSRSKLLFLEPKYLRQFMHTLKVICLTVYQLAKQAWLFPRTALLAFRRKHHHNEQNASENERIDRIRNPSKYLGK